MTPESASSTPAGQWLKLTFFCPTRLLDPQWDNDEGMKRYKAFMAKYAPGEDANSGIATYGYSTTQFLIQILKQCGDDLTRANIMKQATNIKTDFVPDLDLVADVDEAGEGLAPGRLDLLGRGVDRPRELRVRRVGLGGDHDVRAVARRAERDRLADAAAGAGDEEGLALEGCHGCFLSRRSPYAASATAARTAAITSST